MFSTVQESVAATQSGVSRDDDASRVANAAAAVAVAQWSEDFASSSTIAATAAAA